MSDFYPDPVMLRRVKRAQARDTKIDVDDDDDDEEDLQEGGGEGDTTLQLTPHASGRSYKGRRPSETIEDD